MIKQMHKQGVFQVDIAHRLGCSTKTVQRYLALPAPRTGKPKVARTSKLDPYKDFIDQQLPTHPYEYAEIKQARVHIDYHIEYEKHYYSVPHHLVKEQVEIQASDTTVAIHRHGRRVASHPRSYRKGAHTTCVEHMPRHHQAMNEWSPERFLRWASDIGEATQEVVGHILQEKRHKEQSYRRVLALLGNAKHYVAIASTTLAVGHC